MVFFTDRYICRLACEIGANVETVAAWRTLRANAERVKAYDAYHSTTMEGYKISREISDAIIRGERLSDGPQSPATLEAAMAIQGYSIAFGAVLARAEAGTSRYRLDLGFV